MYRDKIIDFLNSNIKWKYPNLFKFWGDLTKVHNGKLWVTWMKFF